MTSFHSRTKRRVIKSPNDTYCAVLVADVFLFCYDRNFIRKFLTIIRLTLTLLRLHPDIWIVF